MKKGLFLPFGIVVYQKRLYTIGFQPQLVGDQVLPVLEPTPRKRPEPGTRENIALEAMDYAPIETAQVVRFASFAPCPIDFCAEAGFPVAGVDRTSAAEHATSRNTA
jgi:hypothetical protein